MRYLIFFLCAPILANTTYFEKEEYNTIVQAAHRNACEGDDLILLLAIRKAENGPKGLEFGIMHPKAKGTNLDTQAAWAACTITKNRIRWAKSGKRIPFITFLGNRYAPVGAENDPGELNKNWIKNITYWYKRIKHEIQR